MEQQHNNPTYETSLVKIEGPTCVGGQWEIGIAIGPSHKTLYGQTPEEIREQTERHIEQQIAELEKSRLRLQEILKKPKKDPWPDTV